MGLFDAFPYSNYHDLNLDFILRKLRELDQRLEDLEASSIGGPLIVTVTNDGGDMSADQTFADILAAVTDGRNIWTKIGYTYYPLAEINSDGTEAVLAVHYTNAGIERLLMDDTNELSLDTIPLS